MIKVFVSENDYGVRVSHVKGIKGGAEWVMRSIQSALAYTPDGRLTIRWNELPFDSSLRKSIGCCVPIGE